jgi:hypothetical protein
MDMFVKTIIAFCIGLGALAGAQHLWVSSMMAQIRAGSSAALPQTQVQPMVAIDPDKLRKAIMPTMAPIDTKRYEALGVESAQRRIDMQIRNAQSAVPVQRSFPGVPRY